MPFTIRLHTTNHAQSDQLQPDPVFGFGILPTFVDESLTLSQRNAVITLLMSRAGHRPGIDDRVVLTLPDGAIAEVNLVGLYGSGPCVAGHMTVNELSMPFLMLAIELAAAGKLILRPDGFPRPLVLDESLRHAMVHRYPNMQSVYSAAMLWNLLKPREFDQCIEQLPQDE